MVRVRVLAAAVVLVTITAVTAYTRRYAKLTPTLPAEVTNSLVGNLSYPGVNYSFACVQKCNEWHCCNLACTAGSECHLYEQRVSYGWPGSGDPDALEFDSCFGSVASNSRRILPVSTSASSTSAGSATGNAVNGFTGRNILQCFTSDPEADPWWMADLGVPKRVLQVRVTTRLDGIDIHPWSVEVRLGDSPDLASNPIFDQNLEQPRPVAAEVVFTPPRPMTGRFLSIQSVDSSSSLALCDVEILDQEKGPLMRNCLDVQRGGHNASGIYTIFPAPCCPVSVFCEMDVDGGGWTVFQRREDVLPREDFYRTWMEYARGFGSSPCREFWLGLDHIHALTSHAPAELRVDLADFEGATAYAKYSSFHVADRASDYKLTVGGYSGTAGDSMIPRQNGYGFSAKDKGLACANKYFGGWWYGSPCHFSNLNGLYLSGPHDTFAVGVNWYHWKGFGYSLKTTVMMTRPVP